MFQVKGELQSEDSKCDLGSVNDSLARVKIIGGIGNVTVREETLSLHGRSRKNDELAAAKQLNTIVDPDNKNVNHNPESYFERSFSEFESINEYCLRDIFKYLQFMDIVNLAATCTTLLNFAKTEYDFSKDITKQVIINGDLYGTYEDLFERI